MKKISEKLSDIFHVSKSEQRITFTVFGILLIGYFLSSLDFTNKQYDLSRLKFEQLVDSLEKATISDTNFNLTVSANTTLEESVDSTEMPLDNETFASLESKIEISSNDSTKKLGLYTSYTKKELPSKKLNLNTSSQSQLITLPNIGKKTAIKIIEFRKQHPFNSIEEIQNVKGIGLKKFEKMKPYIYVKVK